jgi:hypothetical protein
MLVVTGVLASAARAAPQPAEAAARAVAAIGWHDLRPLPVEDVDDPFAAMPDEQIEMLRLLVRARVLEARGFPITDDARGWRAELERRLAAQGVDAAALLARRDEIISKRRAAAEAGVASLDGHSIRLAGYLLPVAMLGGRVIEFLLVAAPGACSHASQPPPNQLVRVRPAQPQPATGPYAPASIRGTLHLRVEERSVHAIDGEVTVTSTYAIDDAIVDFPALSADASPRIPSAGAADASPRHAAIDPAR